METVLQLLPATSENLGDHRGADRQNMFIKAIFKIQGSDIEHPITIRDISSTGLKASTCNAPFVGGKVEVELRNIGTVPATVIWVENGKIGLHFSRIIDPSQTKIEITGTYSKSMAQSVPKLRHL